MVYPKLFLDQFPVELIFDIFGYLTGSEILHSFYGFSRYLRHCIRSYQEYTINFKSIDKREFERICTIIRPDQIRTLTISDDDETPGQIPLFFTHFPTFEQSFTRLEHLRIRNLDSCPDLSQMTSLHTLTVDIIRSPPGSFEHVHIQQYDDKFANFFRLSSLRTLILKKDSVNIPFTFKALPIAEHLCKFQIDLRSIDNLPFIFKCIPNVQKLAFSLNSSSYDNDVISRLDAPPSLTHLTMKVSYGRRDEIERIILSCSTLLYLNIHIERNQVDTHQWLDGEWWQSLIEEFLPQLKTFHLRIDLNAAYDITVTKNLLKTFQSSFWTINEGKYRSFTVGVLSLNTMLANWKQRIIPNQTMSINLPHDQSSILPSGRVSSAEILKLEHATATNECYVVSDLVEFDTYFTNLSKLVHLKLDTSCTIAPSLFSQLLNIAPRLSRLTISSTPNHLRRMMDFKYPQILWLDMRREYLPSKIRTAFCSAFPCLKHLMNCYVYSEEDLEVLVESLKRLQNVTVRIQSYYFDSDDEFRQWLKEHTHLRNFTFRLIDERRINLWIGNE